MTAMQLTDFQYSLNVSAVLSVKYTRRPRCPFSVTIALRLSRSNESSVRLQSLPTAARVRQQQDDRPIAHVLKRQSGQ